MFLIVRSFVLCVPETCMYSQDHIAKKKVPKNSSHKALSNDERVSRCSICRMEAVMVTWGFGGVSVDEYLHNCLCKMYASFWPPFNLGPAWSDILKACAMLSDLLQMLV